MPPCCASFGEGFRRVGRERRLRRLRGGLGPGRLLGGLRRLRRRFDLLRWFGLFRRRLGLPDWLAGSHRCFRLLRRSDGRGGRARPEDHDAEHRRGENTGADQEPRPRRARLARLGPRRRRNLRLARRPGHHEGMDAVRNVLDLTLADVAEGHRNLVRDRLVHRARHADAARLGEALEPCRDVDPVAEKVPVALDHIADRDADAELQAPVRRVGAVAGAQALLDVDRAAHRLDRRVELAHHRVAGGIEDAPAGALDEIVEDLPEGAEPGQRLFLVLGNEARIAGDVRGEDRRDLALHRAAHGDRCPGIHAKRIVEAKGFGEVCWRTRRWKYGAPCLPSMATKLRRISGLGARSPPDSHLRRSPPPLPFPAMRRIDFAAPRRPGSRGGRIGPRGRKPKEQRRAVRRAAGFSASRRR